ncbi:MAG: N-6 DNA methylase, partial [Sedimentisphaerales bacterium]|nr:N-6 DNA methylase [Sedimentisphaerales bacterium]
QKRPLFIPNQLNQESQDNRLKGNAQEKAYEIILKWADLESSSNLSQQSEKNIGEEFLIDVFGNALGYTLFSEGKEQWEFKHKFDVNGGEVDGAIGLFRSGKKCKPRAVIEMKGPTVNVDRDKFNGRTTVQQCWDYLNALPDCPWGIVCNFVSFRLYNQNETPKVYELFTLQDLRKKEVFLHFYYLFERGGLLPITLDQVPRADMLLERSNKRQREVGDELYKDYHLNRLRLIQHLLSEPYNKPLDIAIRIAQKLIDRIVFVAFCEDRDLLPEASLRGAWEDVAPFTRVSNPKWQNYLELFRSIDEGNERRRIPPYDGGLFGKDDEVDGLNLDDDRTFFFKDIGDYDFRYEVNVDVLGHLFEKSINDIEKLRLSGLFEPKAEPEIRPKMEKSAERKKGGIYYTPPEFTEFITNNTVAKIAEEKIKAIAKQYNIDPEDIDTTKSDGKVVRFILESIEALRQIKIVDPACGSGAFLIKAYDDLEDNYQDLIKILEYHDPIQAEKLKERISDFILHDNIFGVDLSPEAVEITQLALWLRSAKRGKTLADLSKNIVCGNSLVTDSAVDTHALDWQKTFSSIFSRDNPGFDCVISNPPWERFTLKNREFFNTSAPHILEAPTAAESRRLIEELKTQNPPLYERYIRAKESAEKTMTYIRQCGRFPLTCKGDINTYAVFAELARTIVSPTGCIGLLVPSGIATDDTTRSFFVELIDSESLIGMYDFENRKKIFPDADSRYKFSALLFTGPQRKSESADFVFFAHSMENLKDPNRHVSLSIDDFKLLNPNTRTCPVFRNKRDAEITKAIYRRVPILVDKSRKEGGNPWGIKFLRMFDQSNDAELFYTADQLKSDGFKRDGPCWKKHNKVFLPLYEAKMIQMYDHRAASIIVDKSKWMRQGQTNATSLVQHLNPEFFVEPRWWVDDTEVHRVVGDLDTIRIIAFKNVTSPTNQRTMIAAFIPYAGVVHSSPLIITSSNISVRLTSCLLGNLNAFAYDYISRQKIGGINLSYFVIKQIPTFHPDFYIQRCPWDKKRILEKWISDRVLKLTCTSNDMIPLAKSCGFDPPIHKWNQRERAELMAELDAAFFILYGIDRKDTEYILSTFAGVRKEYKKTLDGSCTFELVLNRYDRLHKKCHE